ncbi:MAG: glycosyltransferase [Desulfobacteraceae bacterium]|jgi:UDP:flavonoid glycosyltransferase YjiC (YdhE family)
MKILLATYGSRGDVQPMLALALAFQAKGHDVKLAAPPEKAAWAKQMNCPFHPLGSNLTKFVDGLHKVYSGRSMIRSHCFLRKEIETQFETLMPIAANADLVIGSSLVAALPSIAEALKIPYRYIAFTPQILPSANHPCPIFTHQNLPVWYNRLTWLLAEWMDRFNNVLLINRQRRQVGLTPIDNAWRHILGQPVIVASDSVIAKVPCDVRIPKYFQTGYMHLKLPKKSHAPLQRFLSDGLPPVFAGFGSMPRLDQIDSMAIIVKAARMVGQRMVIGKFWDEPTPFDDCRDIFFIGKYPHLDLFPHMAAVIHHGGAGTTATAAICGIPQIIIPHLLDQYYWGVQIHRIKLGPLPIARAKLTVSRLAHAIKKSVSDLSMQKAAKKVAVQIKAQNSVQITVNAILSSLKDINDKVID